MSHGQLLESANGGLRIWRHPWKGGQFVVGVDTAEGVRDGDYSCACVLEAESMEQVAEWHCHMRPTQWGYACARLGWHYNEAPIAFETHPSPYGLEAFNSCERYGYQRMWVQRVYDALEARWTTKKGWRRAANSTAGLLNRVRDALVEQIPIRSEPLLDEMAACRLDASDVGASRTDFGAIRGKIKRGDHDDRIIAYGIALLVRDDSWSRGEIKPAARPVEDLADLYWQRQAALESEPTPENYEEVWDGVS
mgnify:CR=1 FL=1